MSSDGMLAALPSGSTPDKDNNKDDELIMLHLRKLFDEFINLKSTLTDQDRDERLYQMLPLYYNVTNKTHLLNEEKKSPARSQCPNWEGEAAFCYQISQLLAREIKRRALNQSTETASKTIASFLEPHDVNECYEEKENGWILLTVVGVMATINHDNSLQEIMINATLPSTLIRCIYLFLDLPEERNELPAIEISLDVEMERPILLYNAFSQILLQLCANPLAAEELIRVDDLTLLFSTITAQYGPCNRRWRALARDVLRIIARHGISDKIVQYIHAKGCIALCVDNMQRSISSKPPDTVEMLQSIFEFLQQSSRFSQVLLDDFKHCQGYLFLVDFLIKVDQSFKPDLDHNEEFVVESVFQKLMPMIVSLCYCGYSQSSQLHSITDFSKSHSQGRRNACVRNLQAFQVLQTVFLRSSNTLLCCLILDAIADVYNSDDANYYVLESQNTLCIFAEKMYQKAKTVQTKFFKMVEFIVFQLNVIPRKELIAFSVLLKTNQAIETSIECTRTFLRLLKHNVVFVDVYREVGILEVFVTCMKRYKDYLGKNVDLTTPSCTCDKDKIEHKRKASLTTAVDSEEILGLLIMDALVWLLKGNSNNATIFKNSGGNKCVYEMIKTNYYSVAILKIVKELISTVGGEDDMLHLLKSINASTEQRSICISTRIKVLQSLIDCLKESHRTRSIFRKVGGFVYVVNVLDLLKNQFVERQRWDGPSENQVLLFRVVCHTLSVAMRFEPANAKYFQNEVANTLFFEAIRDLGCFSKNEIIRPYASDIDDHLEYTRQHRSTMNSKLIDAYAKIFRTISQNTNDHPSPTTKHGDDLSNAPDSMILPSLRAVCVVYRTLYDIVLDGFDGPQMIEMFHYKSVTDTTDQTIKLGNLTSSRSPITINDYLIVHPSIIVCMLKLLPSVEEQCLSSTNDSKIPEWKGLTEKAMALQYFLSEVIKSFVVRSERNQQIMCDSGLNESILHICKEALIDENHPLHSSLQYIFERLAVQALLPKELRTFLRLELNFVNEHNLCTNYANNAHNTTSANFVPPVPLTRVKTLVSITTPRDFRAHSGSYTMPPFIEMDMSTEGFACIFFPNIAPNQLMYMQSQSTILPHKHDRSNAIGTIGIRTMDSNVSGISDGLGLSASFSSGAGGNTNVGPSLPIETTNSGGIGSGDRSFPSNSGLTFSTWFYVERYPLAPLPERHPIRLLHIVRLEDASSDDASVVFSILILPSDKSLSVATQQFPFTQEYANVYKDEHSTRVWCPTFIQECQWHHVVVTLGKVSPKSSLLSIYLDGRHVHSQKIQSISSSSGTSLARNSACACLHAFIGTPPIWRMYSKLNWKQGICHLVDDSFDASAVARVYMLGPHYLGSFQDVRLEENEQVNPLIMEDKLAFSINPKASSFMTLSKIRKLYNRTDAKAIGKQLGMSSHDNATPIVVLHNAAGHLNGAARTLGGVLVGYLGIRSFIPCPVSMTMNTVGGCSVVLGLVAMSHNIESLYAAVKALTCILRTSKSARQEMNQRRYYQTLSMLYKRKKMLLNSHILHLTFNLVGTVHSGYESSTIPNVIAFQDLLCDFPIWTDPSNDLIRPLLEHLLELVTESNEKIANIKIMQDLQCVSKLLCIIEDITDEGALKALFALLQALLSYQTRSNDLLLFGQYIVKCIPMIEDSRKITSEQLTDRHVHLRNCCLSILHHLHFGPNNAINWRLCDDIVRVLGLEWLLMLMQPHLHHSTMLWAFRILVIMLAREPISTRFREKVQAPNGEEGYLKNTEIILQSRNAILISSSLPAQSTAGSVNVNSDENCDTKHSPQLIGFPFLEWLLHHRIDVPEIFSLLIALVVGYPVKSSIVPTKDKNLQSIWASLWTSATANAHVGGTIVMDKITFCTEAVCILLGIIRTIVHSAEPDEVERIHVGDVPNHLLQSHPCDVLELLQSFYTNLSDFTPIAMSEEVIVSLIAVLFAPAVTPNVDNAPKQSKEEGTSNFLLQQIPVALPYHEPNVNLLEQKSLKNLITPVVMDFLQTLVIDSLSLANPGKTPPVIDMVLEFFITGANISDEQRKHFLTDLISLLMDSLATINIMVEGTIPAISHSQLTRSGKQHVAANVFYLTTRFVDKLWQNMLLIDGRQIFDYCVRLIQQAKRRAGRIFSSLANGEGLINGGNSTNISGMGSLEPLYRSLNRCILYLLAHPPCPADVSLVDILQRLIHNRLLVFGAGNHDPDFFGSLTYCLLQLYHGDGRIVTTPTSAGQGGTTTWHVEPPLVGDKNDAENVSSETPIDHRISELMNLSFRVWEELYVCKKPVIEEIFKVTLTHPLRNARAPNMERTHAQIFESALKHWLSYVEGERRSACRCPWDAQNSIQSKIQKVTGGLTRLTSRTKLKKEPYKRQIRRMDEFTFDAVSQLVTTKLQLVHDYWEFRSAQQTNSYLHTKRYVHQDWLQVEAELIRERAIWGPECCADFTKWTLDSTEGPYRMRKKMLKNVLFYAHYPPRPELMELSANSDHNQQRQIKSRVAISHDSAKYSKFVHMYRNMFPEQFEQDASIVGGSLRSDMLTSQSSEYASCSRVKNDIHGYCLENEEDLSSSLPDNQILLRLLEEKEKVSHIFRTARIQGLDTYEGLLLFGKEYCYIVDGFTLLCNREIRDIDSLPTDSFEPILPSTASSNSHISRSIRQCSKIFYEDIREIHKRRYLLQPIALEVFCGNGQNYLLSFPQKVRNKVFQKLSSMATHIADNAQQSVAGQKRAASVEQNAGLFSSLIGETSVTQRWVRGEISNFQYLMHLNSLAGRSYNDLMQYPVFPWILANYDSETIDLNDPANFRDLAKPMGAQSQERLEQFQKRYKDWDDPLGDTPPYHYGTHYSSAMIICSYLVRLEPFTQHFLRLQGGHFDLADRMFHSIKEAWVSASKQNMADVKELIPEFFYLPEFLENTNSFDLGSKQNGEVLNHVVLPPWAKNDPREFIRLHREALECNYVSRQLHLWIDLIFGCKQQGQASIDAVNVFHHLFYEGNVDIYNIEDPLQKSAAIGFINNFGQIPKQLFRKPHPAKRMSPMKQFSMLVDVSPLIPPLSPIGSTPTINYEKIFYYHLNNLKPTQHPIKEVKGPVGQIIQHEKNVLAVEQNKILIPSAYNRYVAWGYADHSIRVGSYDSDRPSYAWENIDHSGEILACTCPNTKMLILAGTSSVLSVYNIDIKIKKISLKQTLFGHTDAVTALSSSNAYNIIISGSRDRSAIIWDLARLSYVRQLTGHTGVVSAVSINELTGDIATCSGTWLHIWSINGLQLAAVNTSMSCSDRMQQILCVAFSSIREWDANNVIITGSTDGVVRMWSVEFVLHKKHNSTEQLSAFLPEHKDNNLQSVKGNVQWERRLCFRVELTMHTAYDYKVNTEPASITTLAISKDHRTVYVMQEVGCMRGLLQIFPVLTIAEPLVEWYLKTSINVRV
ncbi:WD repeat and FYVE domain-containing protein 3 [Anopheles nili]|uniref:WD repeat and FYVE domain-containing protein 3 n=1 Tax=Anopheles nili TaxID=185578 RepID=UPI00237BC7E5|nr:WD repeat and FYVE domain-containing protein 3 [Anopheles nili]